MPVKKLLQFSLCYLPSPIRIQKPHIYTNIRSEKPLKIAIFGRDGQSRSATKPNMLLEISANLHFENFDTILLPHTIKPSAMRKLKTERPTLHETKQSFCIPVFCFPSSLVRPPHTHTWDLSFMLSIYRLSSFSRSHTFFCLLYHYSSMSISTSPAVLNANSSE